MLKLRDFATRGSLGGQKVVKATAELISYLESSVHVLSSLFKAKI